MSKPYLLREGSVEQLAAESFHFQVRTVLSRLQLALELFEADAALTETQRALVTMALRAAGDLNAICCDPAAEELPLQARRRSQAEGGIAEGECPVEE